MRERIKKSFGGKEIKEGKTQGKRRGEQHWKSRKESWKQEEEMLR